MEEIFGEDKGNRRYEYDVYHKKPSGKGYLAPVSVSVCDYSDIDALNRLRRETPDGSMIKVRATA